MRHICLLAAMTAVLLSGAAKKPPAHKPAPKPTIEVDSDAPYICRIGDYNQAGHHKCHCVAMVAEQWDVAHGKCLLTSATSAEYRKCMDTAVRNPCDVVQSRDTAHPQHTCQRNCNVPRCACHDGPPCSGMSMIEGVQ